ncbi:MAG TPA: glycosyltransferase family 4 protein [Terriglobia bacterium]
MRILVLTQHFAPETAPTGRRAQDLAESLASRGHRVTVIAGRPNHPATLGRFFCRQAARVEDALEGYRVLRVPVFRSSDARAWKRLLTYTTFMLAGAWKGVAQSRPDAIVAISPLPTGLAALAVHLWHRAPLIFDLQDIWPDSARAVGVMEEGVSIRLMRLLERLLYRYCAHVVGISEGFRRYLLELGVPSDRISVIENGVDTGRFSGVRPESEIARSRWTEGRFVVGYVGNIGLAQGLDTVLDAAHRLGREPVSFLLIGEGVDKERLERRARAAGLTHVRFMRGVPRRRVPPLLAACDALLVVLRADPLFRITIPSKVYEYMAAGKPVLCSVGGECADLILEAGCGLAIPPSDGEALAAGIEELRRRPEPARAMGEAGAQWARSHFECSTLMDAYAELLEAVAERASRSAVETEQVSSEAALS